ncbi:pentatricopeptide repeat-containing protein At2g41080 [Morus notabilis]|uniref:pentatricopeptide repeat-containing protein At2g41080 n=1 Tax=Morus notabilis TaxID=981085 RepID=UPI000CED7DCE|nr:pentatricopeptide repeat-containing protein At2g41080 [Morus notabilis]
MGKSCLNHVQEFTALCSKGHVKEAFKSFRSEIWSDTSLFCHLVQACILRKSLPMGKQLHSLTITSGCLNKFFSNHLLSMYSKLRESQTAITLFDHMPWRNIMSCNIMINCYVQSGDLDSARNVFDEMPQRNVATWNAMVSGLIQFEFNGDGLCLFSEMHELGFLPDEYTLGSVLRGCAGLRSLRAGKQVHAYVMKSGFKFDLVVGSSLAHMYMKSGSLEEGEKVIDSMPIRNVVAWNTLIAGKAQSGHPEEVLDNYNIMKLAGLRPDKITFVSVISSCSDLATLGQGQQTHAEAIKAGACSVVDLTSTLVSMYSRCGCLEDSVKVFVESESMDPVLWSSMIAAYGFHGRGEEAIKLFERMEEEGMEADDVAFLSLLYACSHCGLREKGLEFFDLMVGRYGLKPRREHYACIVDLLSRYGCLEEAEAMIRSMPIKADAIIWKILLAACKIHKNADVASRVAEEVLKVDPQDSASYVLLSNVHASAKRWEDVSAVRKMMRDKNLKKEPGVSWVEIKNQVHQFSRGDRSHPKSKEIDLYLNELTTEMKFRGYAPNTSAVLHDMDVEEKEDSLAHHSEKLAIAFALMNTPGGVPLRIMKNLRVCEDCHLAIKYISETKNREIIVRDSSRFHHFRNGGCSCGDYW